MSSNNIRSGGIENREVYWIDIYTIDTLAPLDIKMDVLVKAEEGPIEIPFHCLAGARLRLVTVPQFPSWRPRAPVWGTPGAGHWTHRAHGTMAMVNGVLIHPSCRLSKAK